MLKSKAIFLDRDGVLIKSLKHKNKPVAIDKFEKIKILRTTKIFLDMIRKNFLLIMITNQPDVSRQKISKQFVNKTNNYVKKKLGLDDVFVCFHDNKDRCNCRKPKTGMILDAKKKWNIDVKNSFLIGDREKDIIAGKNVGCINYFIDYNYSEKKPKKSICKYVDSFSQAIKHIKQTNYE
jgi:D-glycero-D-manno-heptose 1,7-bisphosphate phosphatase